MYHNREEVIRRSVKEFERLEEQVANLSEEDWERLVPRPEGKDPWTVKDTLAHITHWKADVIRSIHGQRRPADEQGLLEYEANHLVFMKWHERSPVEVLSWHRQVQEELLETLEAAHDKWFSGEERRAEWPYDLDGHSAIHRTRDIEQALVDRKKD
jgi:uncharacterized damage-inducible protein DinB